MNTTCPLCKKKDYRIVYEKVAQMPEADVVRCNHCNHVFTYLETEIDTNSLYSDEIYKIVENRNSIFDKILSFEYNRVLKKIKILKPGKKSLLDFGSGKGKFGSLATMDGWQVKCVETSIERAQYATSTYGLEVNTNPYSSGKIFDSEFDVLTLFHVLEHLSEPVDLLGELTKANLEEDALIVIEVPNFNSLQSKLAKHKWIHLDVPRHVSHFTTESLGFILKETNLIPVKKSFFSWHLGVLGMLDSFLKILGYKRNIIYELKNKRTFLLLLTITSLLPFAIFFETAASLANRGGILRFYLLKKTK
jgi:predicted Zn finger-like uncharacterized protein